MDVVVFEEPQYVVVGGGLKDLIRVLQREAWYPTRPASRARVEVLVVVLSDSADRSRPRLIRNLSVRRVDDHGGRQGPRHHRVGHERFGSRDSFNRERLGQAATKITLQVRFFARRSWWVERFCFLQRAGVKGKRILRGGSGGQPPTVPAASGC